MRLQRGDFLVQGIVCVLLLKEARVVLCEDGEPDLVDGSELVVEDVEGVLCVGGEGVDVCWLNCGCVLCAGFEVAADDVVDGEEGEAGGDYLSLSNLFVS
jgi:hypothetical protein